METSEKYRSETNVVPTMVSRPGDAMFLQHHKISQKETTTAAYLGFEDVCKLKALMCTAVTLHITCVFKASLPKVLGSDQIRERIEKVYQLFKECASDTEFQAKYDIDDATVTGLINDTAHFTDPNGRIEITLAQLLVWACKWLERPAGASEPKWLDMTYPQHVISLLEPGVEGEVVLPKVEWTDDVRPVLQPPGLDESPFEKYHRIIILTRRTLKFVLCPKNFAKSFMRPFQNAMRMTPNDLTVTGKHEVFMKCHFSGRAKPVLQADIPRWMVPANPSLSNDSPPQVESQADDFSDLVTESEFALQGDVMHDVYSQDNAAMVAHSDDTRGQPIAEKDIQPDVKPDSNPHVKQEVEQDVRPDVQMDTGGNVERSAEQGVEIRTHRETRGELYEYVLAPRPESYDLASNDSSQPAHPRDRSTQKRSFESLQDHEDSKQRAGDANTVNVPKRARTVGPSSELGGRISTPNTVDPAMEQAKSGIQDLLQELVQPLHTDIAILKAIVSSTRTQKDNLETEATKREAQHEANVTKLKAQHKVEVTELKAGQQAKITELSEEKHSLETDKTSLQEENQSQKTQIKQLAEKLSERDETVTALESKLIKANNKFKGLRDYFGRMEEDE